MRQYNDSINESITVSVVGRTRTALDIILYTDSSGAPDS